MKRLLIILIVVGLVGSTAVSLYYFNDPVPVYCEKPFSEREKSVIMFSTRWCPYCKKARRLFMEKQVAYCEYDVDASVQVQDIFTELGGEGVPLILIYDEIFYGFSNAGISAALTRHGLIN